MVKLEYFKEAVKTAQAIYADKTRAFLENKYPGFFPDIYDQLKKEEKCDVYGELIMFIMIIIAKKEII